MCVFFAFVTGTHQIAFREVPGYTLEWNSWWGYALHSHSPCWALESLMTIRSWVGTTSQPRGPLLPLLSTTWCSNMSLGCRQRAQNWCHLPQFNSNLCLKKGFLSFYSCLCSHVLVHPCYHVCGGVYTLVCVLVETRNQKPNSKQMSILTFEAGSCSLSLSWSSPNRLGSLVRES